MLIVTVVTRMSLVAATVVANLQFVLMARVAVTLTSLTLAHIAAGQLCAVPPFTQTDVTRAIKAAVKAGMVVGRFEVDKKGKIVVIAGKASDAHDLPDENEWDRT